ncbi:2-octaprenyl-6-methoxyphenyl hydroxylase [Salinivibrio sp. MA351]|uniref:2-octaprenyl-6-methoxyphenyl hydroxylase n=1 Tax=unclassified Salinivibrio TaxID=2636825 RepID=UPI00098597A5|nr:MULTISPECIES: 2-octaprenyl-6-methoxyphenyl hydroxylase [unclassified Salinivibrio]OOE94219.1 2-octaprenyl-6-methoxyphenyl hydroxylase [Salinivibrio sp. AR647]OOF01327.1 2-octaprenyl-6-methoxyphenyl hydroxylase [Salinivibrio sp. MA351]
MKAYDIVIAGGAMAGATAALALDTLSGGRLRIAVVEAMVPNHGDHPGYDARSIALAEGSCAAFEQLGLWEALAPFGTPIQHIHVSDRGHAGQTHIDAQTQGVSYLGQVIELADAGAVLHQKLHARPAIDVFCPDAVIAIERKLDAVTVTLKQGQSLTASLLIAADGGRSPCSRLLHLPRQQHDFGQVAVIANVSTALPHQGHAFERFTDTGPVALLPMSQGRCSLVWCMTPDEAQPLTQVSDSVFLQRLQQVFGWRLGKLLHVGERHAYPLVLNQVVRPVSHRVAVVGNAAQSLHPIAGQGFNLGLRDVITLAQTVSAAFQRGQDIGAIPVLMDYASQRQPDRDTTVALTSGLVHLFSNQSALLAAARNAGLGLMSTIERVKQPLVQRTIGWVEPK